MLGRKCLPPRPAIRQRNKRGGKGIEMRDDCARSDRQALEARTIAAQAAYLHALNAWEIAGKRCECSRCAHDAESSAQLARACMAAQAEKERLRAIFRDLMDELGYIPIVAGTLLHEEFEGCVCQRGVY